MNHRLSNDHRYANQFEAFFNHASLGIIVVNAAGKIVSANPFLLNAFDYSIEEVMGQAVEMLIPEKFRHSHIAHRANYAAHPSNRPMGSGRNLFGVKKDGTEFPVEISLSHLQLEGEPLVIGFVTDISLRVKDAAEIVAINRRLEEKIAERTQELEKTLKQLEASNHQLGLVNSYQQSIIDNAAVMLFVTNADGIIQFFNNEAENITGYIQEEIIGSCTPVLFHEKEDLERCKQELFADHGILVASDLEAITEKAKKDTLRSIECNYLKKNGNVLPVSVTITPVCNDSKILIGFLGVVIDISERKKAEAELRESLKKEKKLGELKSRFVSMASHEFRTPLSTVLSSAYLAEKYTTTEEQPKRARHLHRIISSVNSLTEILNDFLSVGKIEEGKVQVRVSEFNIKTIITTLVYDMQTNLKKGQHVHYDHQGPEIVLLDATLLKHILLNLLSNAIKFSFEDSNIIIETKVAPSETILVVKDQGIGISAEDQEHLMERFFRASNATNIQGTGLGLHIVSKYAEQMNGKIYCESDMDHGTTFRIIFKPINVPQ